MADMGIFDRTVGLLGKALDLRQQNQEVIASNIANAETPGYAPAKLEFEEDLRRALQSGQATVKKTNPAHFPLRGQGGVEQTQARVLQTRDPNAVGDRNGVQVDQEMITMAENQILYESAVQMLNKKLGMLKYAATDGGK